MRKLGIGLALGVLLAGTSAYAQTTDGPVITDIRLSAESFAYPGFRFTECNQCLLSLPGFGQPITASGSAAFPSATQPTTGVTGNALWDSFVTQHADGTIEFESSNTVGGNAGPDNYVGILSQSLIEIEVAAGAGMGLTSTITPFGFGFYAADVGADGACVLGGTCDQVIPFSEFDFDAFRQNGGYAEVGFNFEVYSTGDFATESLYSVNASLQLNSDGLFNDITDAELKLSTFGLQTPEPSVLNPGYHSYGYGWDETGFTANLSGHFFQTVNYYTAAYSIVRNPCYTISDPASAENGQTRCLIAYSGFGDPIGAGDVFADSLGGIGIFNHDADHTITGLGFTPYTIEAPRIVAGTLVVGNAVPEPATWAMMILGFGLLGSVLRRRRAFAHA
jgi:hypothetical protein